MVPESGCWIWKKALMASGYGCLRIDKKTFSAHRLSWEIHNGPVPDGKHVLHTCDVRSCVSPYHLFLGSNSDNIADSAKKGRRKGVSRNRPRGLKYQLTKRPGPVPTIIGDILHAIVNLRRFGWTQKRIADEVGISQAAVSRALSKIA
jgi:hypothetical protein